MKFLKKQEALNFLNNKLKKNNKHVNNYKLFQEDISRAGSKCFYVTTTKEIFNKIEKLEEPHFYESWTDKSKMVFGIDVDFMTIKDKTDPQEHLEYIINSVIDGAFKYYNYKYLIPNIIVLTNDELAQKLDNPNKFSAHIIFRGLTFENILVVKDFFLRLDKDYKLSKEHHVDKSIYGMSCLRLFLNSKLGKQAILVSTKLNINGEYTCSNNSKSIEDLFDFFELTMLTNIDPNDKIITMKNLNHKEETLIPSNHDNNINNINIENILDGLSAKYYDDYDTWVKVGMILHSYHSEENGFYELWRKWSEKSHKYKEKEMITKWNSFAKSRSKLSIGTLIMWAKEEGVNNIYNNKKLNIEDIVNSYPVKEIGLNTRIVPLANIITLSQPKLTPDVFYPVLQKRLVGIQSEKGTGKTSNLLKTIFESKNSWINDDTSILFISSRISFGIKLLGDLTEYGFDLYSQVKDQQINSKRIICQFDSLLRLDRNKYDLIIVDECESLGRYITGGHLAKNPKASLIEAMFESRVSDANQVYIMDADLSDRTINYFGNIMNINPKNDLYLIINEYKPCQDYTLIYSSYSTWLSKILYQFEQNKRCAIALASNAKAKDLEKLLKDAYPNKKFMLIHKETSEEDKHNLLFKVNEEWIKYDGIIYSPSVSMGVSFDIVGHFDYIFAYGCHESLGAQEWCQMIHRVRSPINKEIYISIDNYKEFNKSEHLFDYNTIERILCSDYYLTNYDLHNNIIPKKIKRVSKNDLDNLDKGCSDSESDSELESETNITSIGSISLDDKVMIYPYKKEPIYDLYVRNCWEIIENKQNFAACFFGYAKYKEYKMLYLAQSEEDKNILVEMKNIREAREEQENEEKINGILEAPDLTQDQYTTIIKQRDEYITKDDKFAISRYNLRKCYNYSEKTYEITREFITNYYHKEQMKWYRNLSTILSTNNQSTEIKLSILKDNQQYNSITGNCFDDFMSKNKYTYHYYALEIIKLMGFNINDLSITIEYPNFLPKLYDTIEWCNESKNELAYKFNLTSYKDLSILGESEKLKYINKILVSQYGLKIKRINNSVHIDNILYRLDKGTIWDDLPNQINYTEDDNTLKTKIIPIELQIKRANNSNNYDSSILDVDIFIDE